MSTARRLRGLVLVLPLAFGLSLGACGSDDGDDGGSGGTSGSGGSSGGASLDPLCRLSDCPNHADPYDTEDECDFVLTWECLDLFRDYADCIQANETCGSNGRSDLVASSDVCNAAASALANCSTM